MQQYRVLHTRAGSFKQGEIIREDQIVDLPFWLNKKAVEPVTVLAPGESPAAPQAPEVLTDEDILARIGRGETVAARDVHHKTAGKLGLVKSEDGTAWVKPAES